MKSKLIKSIPATLLLTLGLSSTTLANADERTPILVEPAELDALLGEMRSFLEAVQSITEGIAKDNMEAVSQAASVMGMRAAQGVPAPLMAKLPLEFKKLGMVTHQAFDEISLSASISDEPIEIVAELSELLLNCTACHASYRFGIQHQGN
ncbi:MAG: hypothetical protein KUG74_06815 [Rhodobacteraceae bacterium]|nr:hypothetical protein [Paracoccaceae bacterium]